MQIQKIETLEILEIPELPEISEKIGIIVGGELEGRVVWIGRSQPQCFGGFYYAGILVESVCNCCGLGPITFLTDTYREHQRVEEEANETGVYPAAAGDEYRAFFTKALELTWEKLSQKLIELHIPQALFVDKEGKIIPNSKERWVG